jgi:hypothetical protein
MGDRVRSVFGLMMTWPGWIGNLTEAVAARFQQFFHQGIRFFKKRLE